jgi:hypothetical protein
LSVNKLNNNESVGTTADMVVRIKSVLPTNWFCDTSPNLDALLAGLGSIWSGLYSLLRSVRLQARIATASGVFLDIAAQDYCGDKLSRRAGEADYPFSLRIRANLLAPHATREALVEVLLQLTGRHPKIFEPTNSSDTGGYNTSTLGYNTTGGYGSMMLPYQVFVTAYRPNSTPVSNAGGYNMGPGGYNNAPMFYIESIDTTGVLNDVEIYAAITETLPVNAVAWTHLLN